MRSTTLYASSLLLAAATSVLSAPTVTPTVGQYNFQGCYVDTGNPRPLNAVRYVDYKTMSLDQCAGICKNGGYAYFGVEYWGECYCDNTLSYSTPASTTDCDYTCPGNAAQYCGAGSRLSLYKLAGASSSTSTTTVKSTTTSTVSVILSTSTSTSSYWLESIKHQGIAAFNSNKQYPIFRNVKDYGAKGDGVTDDTAAIKSAMSAGGRCIPGTGCNPFGTTTPAVIYIPCGTYIISSSIIMSYHTEIIGNPNCMPVLKAAPTLTGFGIIDGDVYGANGLSMKAVNMFWRQIRNLILDTTAVPAGTMATGIHWPTAQATTIQNCIFYASSTSGTQHVGLFIEDGSGGFMNDLIFYGGNRGAFFGNQQFTVRNLTFNDAVTGVYMAWDWGWTYQEVAFKNCTTGIDFSNGGRTAQAVGSIIITDSTFTNVKVALLTAHDKTSSPASAGSLIIENMVLVKTPVAVQGPSGVQLAGGSLTINGWGQGHSYTPTSGPTNFQSSIVFSRPAPLKNSAGKWLGKSKPQYQNVPVSQFVSVRTAGAKGDGVTDDTAVLNSVLASAAAANKIVFFDSGYYRVTSTIKMPKGSRVVGEAHAVILAAGAFFNSNTAPQPVVLVGNPGDVGSVEWSDMIVSTQGATAGAILVQWNLASKDITNPSGMWEVHTRIGGFAGSQQQLADCPTTIAPKAQCQAAFMHIYIAPSASGVYLENTWFWTADHDIEDPEQTTITVYTGRGLYCASTAGTIWMYGTAVEHNDLYQYQFASTKNIYMGQIQTETPYWQPTPAAGVVTPSLPAWNDPNFTTSCSGVAGTCAMAWGFRSVNSSNLYIHGAGLYSFFNAYKLDCSNKPSDGSGTSNNATCQSRIFGIEGSKSTAVNLYNLNTVGSTQMLTKDGKPLALARDNVNVYPNTFAMFRS